MSILEAMACAMPVLSTRIGAIPEQVIEGQTGLLVPPGDAVALGAALGDDLDLPVDDAAPARWAGASRSDLSPGGASAGQALPAAGPQGFGGIAPATPIPTAPEPTDGHREGPSAGQGLAGSGTKLSGHAGPLGAEGATAGPATPGQATGILHRSSTGQGVAASGTGLSAATGPHGAGTGASAAPGPTTAAAMPHRHSAGQDAVISGTDLFAETSSHGPGGGAASGLETAVGIPHHPSAGQAAMVSGSHLSGEFAPHGGSAGFPIPPAADAQAPPDRTIDHRGDSPLPSAGGDPALPPGAVALAGFVFGPPAVMARLARRLAQVGVVARADGPRLAAWLQPGQRLVTREGDLWRWDGVVAAAEAPTAAARRLAERNRLADLEAEAEAARTVLDDRRAAAAAAELKVRDAAAGESQARELRRAAQRTAETARTTLEAAERRAAQHLARLAALGEARTRIAAAKAEGEARRGAVEAEMALLDAPHIMETDLARARAAAAERRAALGEARAACEGLRREASARLKRLEAIAAERRSWQQRAGGAGARLAAMAARKAEAEAERDDLAEAPATLLLKRRGLLSALEAAEAARREAADRLAEGEAARTQADRAARDAMEALARGREDMARAEARRDAARQRRDELAREIAEAADGTPDALRTAAGLGPGAADLPDPAAIEAALEKARRDRDRLGAVNLRADVELAEAETQHTGLATERDDLIEAIKRLRAAINSLNREARERLQASFVVVDGHFRSLFDTLFGGGEAELVLTDADDPLEAGLDIIAKPPGKKPQTLSLLSGGEQALTAMALIFAVFLTNPAPICVLDEVDAPLDDANVERFCALLEEMTRRTDTRFLTITHNPITMAHMNRLFGVTMAERGVSRLVSVDLKSAERMREAG